MLDGRGCHLLLELGIQQVLNRCLLNEGQKRGKDERTQGISDLSCLKKGGEGCVFYYILKCLLIKGIIGAQREKFQTAHQCVSKTHKHINPREGQAPSSLSTVGRAFLPTCFSFLSLITSVMVSGQRSISM